MNLFVLDKNPIIAAQLQCDKHVVKMIVESAQMLSTVHRMLDGVETKKASKSGKRIVKAYVHPIKDYENTLYSAVHHHHPCTVWTMESSKNYQWHFDHWIALMAEYTFRYGKRHATEKLIDYLVFHPKNMDKNIPCTPFKLAMKSNPECMHEEDPVRSYREYYQTKQDRFKMVWTKREIPEWFNVKEVEL